MSDSTITSCFDSDTYLFQCINTLIDVDSLLQSLPVTSEQEVIAGIKAVLDDIFAALAHANLVKQPD